MTDPAREHSDSAERVPMTRIVLATHSREVKTAVFHSLNAMSTISIVATATSTSELVSYCHAFRPEMLIVEAGLPGRPLDETLAHLAVSSPNSRILLIGEDHELTTNRDMPDVMVLADLGQLIDTLPEEGAATP